MLLEILKPLSRRQIAQLVEFGTLVCFQQDHVAMVENDLPKDLYLMIDGQASVWKSDELLVNCGRGTFLGDLGFISDRPSSATVKINKGARAIRWNNAELAEQLRKSPEIRGALFQKLASDISTKLVRQEDEARLESAAI